MRRVLKFPGLVERGVCGSRMSLHRLRQDPNFPKPIAIGGGIGWFEDEIDEWLGNRKRIEGASSPISGRRTS
jgi:predicted DNA-binding transcriptional regulator AlpA